MKTLLLSSLLVLTCTFCIHADPATDGAVKAAESWLKLVDSARYDESWSEAATYFKSRVKQESWVIMVQPVRAPLGAVKQRQLMRASYTKTLPGAPDGEYVVIEFATSFEKKERAIETITPMKDSDGQWRVSGYFIK